MSDELDDLIQGFVEESHEAFDAIENDLLNIEENPEDLTIVNGIFRVMHTIKGTAGFMGLDDINHLAHKLETLFDMIRKETMQITPELMDTLLPAIDLLKLMVFELVEAQRSEYDLSTRELFKALLRQGVIIRPLDEYGLPHYVRISIGTPLQNKALLAALKNVLAMVPA